MKRVKPTSFVVEPNLIKSLRDYCEARGIKISWFVSTAIKEKLGREGGQ